MERCLGTVKSSMLLHVPSYIPQAPAFAGSRVGGCTGGGALQKKKTKKSIDKNFVLVRSMLFFVFLKQLGKTSKQLGNI